MPTGRKWGRLERLRPGQIEAIQRRTPVAYVPWGALEWHAVHDPVGLDGLAAQGLCEALARETGGVVLPAVYAGTDTIKILHPFGHTLEHKAAMVRTLAGELLDQLADVGYRAVVVVTGHVGGKHVAALRAAVEGRARRHRRVRFLLIPAPEPVKRRFRGDHAAVNETSLLLHLHSGTVDLSRLPKGRLLTLPRDGIWGRDPRKATAARGKRILSLFVRSAAPGIRKLLREVR